jgi:hypothetical protein
MCVLLGNDLDRMNSLARQVTVTFYRAKDTIYNAWLQGGLHCILSKGLHHKAHR